MTEQDRLNIMNQVDSEREAIMDSVDRRDRVGNLTSQAVARTKMPTDEDTTDGMDTIEKVGYYSQEIGFGAFQGHAFLPFW